MSSVFFNICFLLVAVIALVVFPYKKVFGKKTTAQFQDGYRSAELSLNKGANPVTLLNMKRTMSPEFDKGWAKACKDYINEMVKLDDLN